MTGRKGDSSEKHVEELETIKEENLRLKEELQLQRTNWLYSHHFSLSILFGVMYGSAVAFFTFFAMYALNSILDSYGLATQVIVGLGFFVFLVVPLLSLLLAILFLKAPRFAIRSSGFYLFSFVFFEGLLLYIDPLNMWSPQYQGVDRLNEVVFPILAVQMMFLVFALLLAPSIADRCGYRFVLDGSVFGFEVDADIDAVRKQMNTLENDFNLVQDRRSGEPNLLRFTKTIEKKKIVLQFFLRPKEEKTDVVLIMRSVTNDIPMRADRGEVERIGKTLMKWLEVSNNYKVRAIEEESLFNEVSKESMESFYRQPVALPSKKVVKESLRKHWKDLAIILSLLIAALAWLFPR